MSQENWKYVKYFEGKYKVSDLGRVKDKKGNLIKGQVNNDEYETITLANDSGKYSLEVYKLVAVAFVNNDNPEKNTIIKHIDGDKTTNRASNLGWISRKIINHRFPIKKVDQLDPKTNKIINTFLTIDEACDYLGIKTKSRCTKISYVCIGKSIIAYGYKWKYADDDQPVTKNPKPANKLKSNNGEIWKDIEDYEELYQVSNQGRIKSKTHKRCLTPYTDKGFYCVNLSKDNKMTKQRVHKLVAQHFMENTNGKKMISHIDGDKLNNFKDNLAWGRTPNIK